MNLNLNVKDNIFIIPNIHPFIFIYELVNNNQNIVLLHQEVIIVLVNYCYLVQVSLEKSYY